MSSILVTGGAGYVGSHVIPALKRRGDHVVVFDNLSRGHRFIVDRLGAELVIGDLADREALERLFARDRFDAILHFAAVAYVGESTLLPDLYYRTNTLGTLNLVQQLLNAAGTAMPPVVFSSTCAVFGVPDGLPLDELSPKRPISPYGRSKLAAEWILADLAQAYGLRSVVLRYFNAAGADLDAALGELHEPETHLIPLAIRAALERTPLQLYGDDFDTPDGTPIRDFVHVCDLADAHLLALDHLLAGGGCADFNLGSGAGSSVRDVVRAVEAVAGVDVPLQLVSRRPGDPSALVSDSLKAREQLGWQPRRSQLTQIVGDALAWHLRRGLPSVHVDAPSHALR